MKRIKIFTGLVGKEGELDKDVNNFIYNSNDLRPEIQTHLCQGRLVVIIIYDKKDN